jgi:hypothetical protein
MPPQDRSPFVEGQAALTTPSPGVRARAEQLASTSPFVRELEEERVAERIEDVMTEPARPSRPTEIALPPHLRVVDASDAPVSDGEYAFHQGGVIERGRLASGGLVALGKIDRSKPFQFEIRDRVCTIRVGAFLNPDDASIEYGGTQVDWTLVRDDRSPDRDFWPHYQREMDVATRREANETTLGRHLDRFAQHEHITRRPIQIAKPFVTQPSQVRICAQPAQLRVGPFVRYADHERAVIWMETTTPCMIRARFKVGHGTESARYAATIRVGGRHFGAVELDSLPEGGFFDYTVELAPLPATGAVPVNQADLALAFPTLTAPVTHSIKKQLASASLTHNEWLSARTLHRRYDRQLRFATGSCRWYPGDKRDGKDYGPDMLARLGGWLRVNPKAAWPEFLFFGGDQIYSDEIGDDHGELLARSRFASRIPGPADPAAPAARLVDGAWAGRFAHRYRAYKSPSVKHLDGIRKGLAKLDDLHHRYPDIQGIYKAYPDLDPEKALRRRYDTLHNRRALGGAKAEADDERQAHQALSALPKVKALETYAGPYRAFLAHWNAGLHAELQRNPMVRNYLSHNFLLWRIPDFEDQLPTITATKLGLGVRTSDHRGYPSVERGRHAADFAEYAYLYERAWTSSRDVRLLLAHVPTFLMLDDHEATDDWNFSVSWVRMLHNPKDGLGMWPKTLTDSLAAYWVYQGWCNKAPSQWPAQDPRAKALRDAQRTGTDALPALRRAIHAACFSPVPSADPKAPYQAGLGLDWHYRLPFDPPFLVPDCRTRKRLVPADDELRVIHHDDPSKRAPASQTIDDAQLRWMRDVLGRWSGPVAFLAPSTPLMLQKKLTEIMMKPEVAARAWAQGADVVSGLAAVLSSTALGIATNKMLTVFRRGTDLEHMMRERSWRDLWDLVGLLHKKQSPLKTLVLVSGDVHHAYCMTGHLPGRGRPTPEILQITSSGLQTTIRRTTKSSIAEGLSSRDFNVGAIRLRAGYMQKNQDGSPDLALFENSVALVEVTITGEVGIKVTHLANTDRYTYRYTSGAAYLADDAPGVPGWQQVGSAAGPPRPRP